jgi:hypothetical protein
MDIREPSLLSGIFTGLFLPFMQPVYYRVQSIWKACSINNTGNEYSTRRPANDLLGMRLISSLSRGTATGREPAEYLKSKCFCFAHFGGLLRINYKSLLAFAALGQTAHSKQSLNQLINQRLASQNGCRW